MSAAEKLAAAVRRAHVDGEGPQHDCEVCQALKEFENQKPQGRMNALQELIEAAKEISRDCEDCAIEADKAHSVGERRAWLAVSAKLNSAIARAEKAASEPQGWMREAAEEIRNLDAGR